MGQVADTGSFRRRAVVYGVSAAAMIGALWFASEVGRRGKDAQLLAGILPIVVLLVIYAWDGGRRMARFEAETGCVPKPSERRAQRVTIGQSLKSGRPPATGRYDPLLIRVIDHQLRALRPARQALLFGPVFVGMGLYEMVLLNHVGPLLLMLGIGAVAVPTMCWVMNVFVFPKRRARLERLRQAIVERSPAPA